MSGSLSRFSASLRRSSYFDVPPDDLDTHTPTDRPAAPEPKPGLGPVRSPLQAANRELCASPAFANKATLISAEGAAKPVPLSPPQPLHSSTPLDTPSEPMNAASAATTPTAAPSPPTSAMAAAPPSASSNARPGRWFHGSSAPADAPSLQPTDGPADPPTLAAPNPSPSGVLERAAMTETTDHLADTTANTFAGTTADPNPDAKPDTTPEPKADPYGGGCGGVCGGDEGAVRCVAAEGVDAPGRSVCVRMLEGGVLVGRGEEAVRKPYTLYQCDLTLPDGRELSALRRYSDFLLLDDELHRALGVNSFMLPCISGARQLPRLPAKTFWWEDKLHRSVTSEREAELHSYLQAALDLASRMDEDAALLPIIEAFCTDDAL